MAERVIYIVRSWPRLSQTFVVNEVLALERRGLDLTVFSLVHSRESLVQPEVAHVRAPVHFVEDAVGKGQAARIRTQVGQFLRVPLRYASSLWFCWRNPELAAGYGECSALRCFLHAVEIAAMLDLMSRAGDRPMHVHAHFAHDPALVGLLVARLTGLRFSFTAHARDLVEIPPASLAARASRATAVVTCCAANADYLRSAVPATDRPPVLLIHHGVDLDRFVPRPRGVAAPVPRLLSVGRLVPKKGYADLLHALAAVRDRGIAFRCRIYGDGPLLAELARLREGLGLDQVELMGPGSTDQIVAALGDADAFVLAPLVVESGDRDGIPNVLVEAMAAGLPVATTTAGGITELVRHDDNGLLSEPGDTVAMAGCVARLLVDPECRARLGKAARRTVEQGYDVDAAARRLEPVLRGTSGKVLEASR